MTHAHITSWLVMILLFFITVSMQRSGAAKANIVQMILRLFYIITIITGLLLLHSIATISGLYLLKALAGLWVIGAMEMVLMAGKKGKSAAAGWTQWVIALVVTLFLGLLLPLGFDVF
ncbi:YisL family protein [Geobacillus subterraneus]|uniref:YisL family protein n=1 Tax=Geobacillus subterraneus TaxID=129338 RepID=UPI001612E8B5